MSPTSCFWTKPASPPICFGGTAGHRVARASTTTPPAGAGQTSTLLAALRVTGLTAPGVFDGAIDGESFRAYIDQILVPTLHSGDIVIADNLGGPTRSPASSGPSRPPGGHTLVLATLQPGPQSHRALLREAQGPRSHRSLSQHRDALAVPRRSTWRTSALTNAAPIFGTAGTRSPHGHESALEWCM